MKRTRWNKAHLGIVITSDENNYFSFTFSGPDILEGRGPEYDGNRQGAIIGDNKLRYRHDLCNKFLGHLVFSLHKRDWLL